MKYLKIFFLPKRDFYFVILIFIFRLNSCMLGRRLSYDPGFDNPGETPKPAVDSKSIPNSSQFYNTVIEYFRQILFMSLSIFYNCLL